MGNWKWIFLVMSAFAVSGCSLLYRIDVQQGNIVTPEQVTQLKIGMTASKVRYIMGNPLLRSVFHQRAERERWDYYYSLRKGWGKMEQKHLTLFLENDSLVEAKGDLTVPLGQETQPTEPKERVPVL